MESSNEPYGQLWEVLQDDLSWLTAAADREFETETVLAASADEELPDRLTVLVDVLATALVTTDRAENAIQNLLGEVSEAQGEKQPTVRFEHPTELRPGWTLSPSKDDQGELVDLVEMLRSILEARS